MDVILVFLLLLLAFCGYMIIRNMMVYSCRVKFIEYFFHEDPDGYMSGAVFSNRVPGYDEMMLKFWI